MAVVLPVTSGGPHGILFQKNVAKLKNYLLNQQTSHVKLITQFKQDKENILLSPSTTVQSSRVRKPENGVTSAVLCSDVTSGI